MYAFDDKLLKGAETSNLTAVEAGLQKGADGEGRDGAGWTGLMTASMHSAIPIMQVLLQAGAGVDLQAVLGESALICAASARGGESIELLLANGTDPNIGDRDKKRPLMWLVDTPVPPGGGTARCRAPVGRGRGPVQRPHAP